MTASVHDLAAHRARRNPDLLRQQLERPLRSLPPTPTAGKVKGDWVRFPDGRVGWVSEHRISASGQLMLCVRVDGCGNWVMAKNVEPVRRP